ncbi:unnamed protein product [Caenorhabditis bovis]|uniref:DUF38 domain-containing protein n=1 Tax=Caenorhabditis bovis TaxID=2654633 RepID=A0A8S1ED59_9PELO|nr:unnamed protein product [Caenorhabditis bovis]
MLKKLCALLILLKWSSIYSDNRLEPVIANITGRDYCTFPVVETGVYAMSTSDRFPVECGSIANFQLFMVGWNESEVNRILSKIEYLYNVDLFIENTDAEVISFPMLKELINVRLIIAYNPYLETIDIPERVLMNADQLGQQLEESSPWRPRFYPLLEIHVNPALNDSNLAMLKKYCKLKCPSARREIMEVKYSDYYQQKFNTPMCYFDTQRFERTTFFRPEMKLLPCINLLYVKIYVTSSWTKREAELYTVALRAFRGVTLVVMQSNLEIFDLGLVTYAQEFNLYLLDNPFLKEVRFSDELLKSPLLRGATSWFGFALRYHTLPISAIHSFNNPQLSWFTYTTMKTLCYSDCEIEPYKDPIANKTNIIDPCVEYPLYKEIPTKKLNESAIEN